jgi:threonyl-tRNA synthetase
VYTPVLAKRELYERSGHWAKFADDMFPPMLLGGEEFVLRPANCPHHALVYASRQRSVRDLPLRLSELASMFRSELSGVLPGLSRVRQINLDDIHVFCAPDQVGDEIVLALQAIQRVHGKLGVEVAGYRLSRRGSGGNYLGDAALWSAAEDQLAAALDRLGLSYQDAEGEAAFYGPKIDVQMKDVRGIENTAFTVQYDFLAPGRFELSFVDKDGETKLCKAVIHRSSIGAIERIMAFLIEHYRGSFPLWLSPVQVKVIPVREQHNAKAEEIFAALNQAGIRAEVDTEDANLGTKVRDAKTNKIPYWIVLGDKEVESGKLTLESRDQGPLGQLPIEEVLNKLQAEIKDKK